MPSLHACPLNERRPQKRLSSILFLRSLVSTGEKNKAFVLNKTQTCQIYAFDGWTGYSEGNHSSHPLEFRQAPGLVTSAARSLTVTLVFSYCGRENKTSQNGQSEDAHNQQRPKPEQKTGNVSGNNQNHSVRQSCDSSFTNSHLLLLLYPAD